MTNKEAFEAIKQLFSMTPEAAPAPNPAPEAPKVDEGKVELAEYALEDGTKVMISALEVGGKVEMENGEAAPAGDHKLADGYIISVDETGVITAVTAPEAPKEDTPSVEVEVESKKAEEFRAKFTEEIEAKLSEMTAKFETEKAELKAQIETLQGKVAQGFSQVADLVESIAKEPKAEPTQKVQNNFSAHVNKKENKFEQVERFKKAILNNK